MRFVCRYGEVVSANANPRPQEFIAIRDTDEEAALRRCAAAVPIVSRRSPAVRLGPVTVGARRLSSRSQNNRYEPTTVHCSMVFGSVREPSTTS